MESWDAVFHPLISDTSGNAFSPSVRYDSYGSPVMVTNTLQEKQQSRPDPDRLSWATEFPSATVGALSNKQSSWTQHMQSTGFRPVFTDKHYGSSDQVRHAIGGLYAGFVAGRTSRLFMDDWRESSWADDAPKESHDSDLALNSQTIPMGETLAGENGIQAALRLGTWIRDTLCNPLREAQGH